MGVNDEPRVVVVGATGFVGQHLCARLVDAQYRVTAVTRRSERAQPLILLPTLDVAELDATDSAALAAVAAGADAIVNLAGILNERGADTFERAHVDMARSVAGAARAAGVRRVVQMSALNADPQGPSRYLRSKGEAEAIIAASGLDWTIFRPSVIFGPGDSFTKLFARLQRSLPLLPLAGSNARFQPVYIGDVVRCFMRALGDPATIGHRYALCGPKVYTLLELVRYVGAITHHERPILPLGPTLGRLQAFVLEHLPGKLMSRDNLASMRKDSIDDGVFPQVFGIVPTPLEAVAPSYLAPDAGRDPFDAYRAHSGR
jgi:NADH dehydrogenase